MRRIVIEVPDHAFSTLTRMASRERRDVRAQAAWLLERSLARATDSCISGPDEPVGKPVDLTDGLA
jgi:hypothetical protein